MRKVWMATMRRRGLGGTRCEPTPDAMRDRAADASPRGPFPFRCTFTPWTGSLLHVQTPQTLTPLAFPGSKVRFANLSNSHVEVSILGKGGANPWHLRARLYVSLSQGHFTCRFNPSSSSVDTDCPTSKSQSWRGDGTAMTTGKNFGRCPFNGWQPRQPVGIHARHFLPCDLNTLPGRPSLTLLRQRRELQLTEVMGLL